MKDNTAVLGLPSAQGSALVGLIGISNTVARLVLGVISQTLNRSVSSLKSLVSSLKSQVRGETVGEGQG